MHFFRGRSSRRREQDWLDGIAADPDSQSTSTPSEGGLRRLGGTEEGPKLLADLYALRNMTGEREVSDGIYITAFPAHPYCLVLS